MNAKTKRDNEEHIDGARACVHTGYIERGDGEKVKRRDRDEEYRREREREEESECVRESKRERERFWVWHGQDKGDCCYSLMYKYPCI